MPFRSDPFHKYDNEESRDTATNELSLDDLSLDSDDAAGDDAKCACSECRCGTGCVCATGTGRIKRVIEAANRVNYSIQGGYAIPTGQGGPVMSHLDDDCPVHDRLTPENSSIGAPRFTALDERTAGQLRACCRDVESHEESEEEYPDLMFLSEPDFHDPFEVFPHELDDSMHVEANLSSMEVSLTASSGSSLFNRSSGSVSASAILQGLTSPSLVNTPLDLVPECRHTHSHHCYTCHREH